MKAEEAKIGAGGGDAVDTGAGMGPLLRGVSTPTRKRTGAPSSPVGEAGDGGIATAPAFSFEAPVLGPGAPPPPQRRRGAAVRQATIPFHDAPTVPMAARKPRDVAEELGDEEEQDELEEQQADEEEEENQDEGSIWGRRGSSSPI